MKRAMVAMYLIPLIAFGALSERDEKNLEKIEQYKLTKDEMRRAIDPLPPPRLGKNTSRETTNPKPVPKPGSNQKNAQRGDGKSPPNARRLQKQGKSVPSMTARKSTGVRPSAMAKQSNSKPPGKISVKSDYYMAPPLGALRGVGTVASAAFDPLWGFAWGAVQTDDSGDGAVLGAALGTVFGCFIAVGDVCMGCADILSGGWLGNEYFYNKSECGLEPWFFERPIKKERK